MKERINDINHTGGRERDKEGEGGIEIERERERNGRGWGDREGREGRREKHQRVFIPIYCILFIIQGEE